MLVLVLRRALPSQSRVGNDRLTDLVVSVRAVSLRKRDVAKLFERYGWTLHTKPEIAADLVLSAVETLQHAGRQV